MGRQGFYRRSIAQKTGKSNKVIDKFLNEHGILAPQTIKNMMKEHLSQGGKRISAEEWTERTGVYAKVIEKFVIEVQAEFSTNDAKSAEKEIDKASTKTSKRDTGVVDIERKSEQEPNEFKSKGQTEKITGVTMTRNGRIVVETSDDQSQTLNEAPVRIFKAKEPEKPKGTKSEQELAQNLGISVDLMREIKKQLGRFPAVSGIAKQYKINSDIVQSILDVVKQEEYARTHTVVDYRKKMVQVRSSIERTDDTASSVGRGIIESQVDVLVQEFPQFLTEQDYALLAYGYAKIKSYQKGIELGESKLGLETPTEQGLLDKIREVQERANKKAKEPDDYSL